MSDTPETDAQLTTFTSISKLKKHFVNRTGTVSAEFARGLERERDQARLEAKLLRVENNHNWQANDLAEQAFRERDEARDLAYRLYWAAFDLKRFARAYAQGYDEADGVDGETKAEEAFYEASRNIAKILGLEAEQHLTTPAQ